MSGIFAHANQLLHHVPPHRRLSQEFVEIHQSRRDGDTDAGRQDCADCCFAANPTASPSPKPTHAPTITMVPTDGCPPGEFNNLETPGELSCESCSLLAGDCADCECEDFSPAVEANCKAACDLPTAEPTDSG